MPPLKDAPADATRQREGADDARDDGGASREPDVRAAATRSWTRSGFALENFDAVGAWRTQDEGVADRCRPACWSTARRSTASASLREALLRYSGSVRARRHREAADLRARPRRRVSGHAAGARRSCATRQPSNYRFSSLVLGHRQERAVSDEHEDQPSAPSSARPVK